MEEKKLISIIIPVYNAEKYLDNCLETLVDQTYPHIEIILVDDGSPDRSPEICDKFAAQDARIKVIHKANEGVSAARNCGILASKGNYIMFVDSDDWVELNFVEVMLNTLIQYDADIVNCQYILENKNYKKFDSYIKYDNFMKNNYESIKILNEDSIVTNHLWRNIFKRKLFKNIKFPVGKNYEDICVMHDLFFNSDKIVFIGNTLYHYFSNECSIVHTKSFSNYKDAIDALLVRAEFLEKNMPDEAVKFKKNISTKIYKERRRNMRKYKKSKDINFTPIIQFCEEYISRVDFRDVEFKRWFNFLIIKIKYWFKTR